MLAVLESEIKFIGATKWVYYYSFYYKYLIFFESDIPFKGENILLSSNDYLS